MPSTWALQLERAIRGWLEGDDEAKSMAEVIDREGRATAREAVGAMKERLEEIDRTHAGVIAGYLDRIAKIKCYVVTLEQEIDECLALLRAPDSTNDGGRANLAEEIKVWRHNNRVRASITMRLVVERCAKTAEDMEYTTSWHDDPVACQTAVNIAAAIRALPIEGDEDVA